MKLIFFNISFVFWLLAGFTAFGRGGQLVMKPVQPANVFISTNVLSEKIKRVVILPLAFDPADSDLSSGSEVLEPIVDFELIRAKRFEVVCADTETLRGCFGSWNWTGAEELPTNFLSRLQDTYGADAVLFCQLTEFRAYAPLAVGWRLKLVDVRSKKILWAADEIFDAQDSATAIRAETFRQFQPLPFIDRNDKWLALNSPRNFGRFTIATLLKTLPER